MEKDPQRYTKVTNKTIEEISCIVGEENVITDKDSMGNYSHDETARAIAVTHCPDLVVKPANAEEVSKILRLANEYGIPVTPRGGGTGLSGGAVPIFGGIVLSLERLDQILEIDENSLMMTVQAGATLADIYKALEGSDLFFPPHPGDETAYIGGVVATNAGGVRCVKYGVIRDFVKGAEVVLPTGEVVSFGGKLLKHNTGYNLLQLMIGSEGTLGIFTKIILRLLPKPKEMMILLLPYDNKDEAIKTVPKILRRGIIPLGIEYIEKRAIKPTEEMLGKSWPAKEGEAFLMIIVEGKTEEELLSTCEEIASIGEENNSLSALIAESKNQQETIMDIRSKIYEALKSEMIEILDIGVPPDRIAEFVDRVREISERFGLDLPVYGHAGDGNIHIHVMKSGLTESVWREKHKDTKKALFQIGQELGGVISAEHGVGLLKIDDLHYTLSEEEIDLMRRVKGVFDPNNILNPGKVIPAT